MVLERELGKMQLYMNWVCKGIMDCNGCENIKDIEEVMVACDVDGDQSKKKREVYQNWISDVNCILIKTCCYMMWYDVDLINYFIKVLNTTLRKKMIQKKLWEFDKSLLRE